jgi:outer membrane protein assembly factor BamB
MRRAFLFVLALSSGWHAFVLVSMRAQPGHAHADEGMPPDAETRADEVPSPETLPPELGTRAAGIDWPDFLGPQRNARSPETGLPTDWTGVTPRIVWQCELGESYGAPSISRGRLFHFDRHEGVHRLTCRNSETGAELWKYEIPANYTDMLGYNNGPRATPVVDDNRVYVVTPEGGMHCVRVTDGQRAWSVDTVADFGVVKNFFGVGSTPLVWGDLLIANVGGSPPGSPSDVDQAGGRVEGNGTGVVAFDKQTGEIRWKATDELASYASPVVAELSVARPKSAPGVVPDDEPRSTTPREDLGVPPEPYVFVFARGGLVALDPRTGAVDFQFPWRAGKLQSVNASSPVIVGDEVFISESYGPGSALLRVKDAPAAPTGDSTPRYEVVWQDEDRSRDKALELHWNTAVHHDGHLYASSGQHTGSAELRCIEWKTGAVKWREPRLGRSSLLQVDGCFVCLSEEGALRVLRTTSEKYEVLADITPRNAEGEPLLTYPAWTAPVLSHGLLYVRGANRLVCLELISPVPKP